MPEQSDGSPDVEVPKAAENPRIVAAAETTEAVEVEPQLSLKVAAPCKNPHGLYVGLSKAQREKLGVEVGEVVELRDGNKVLGLYTVGLGSKELSGQPEAFTANGVKIGDTVEVVKAKKLTDKLSSLPLSFAVENDEKHAGRSEIIAKRFKDEGFDGQSYVVVPTATAGLLTTQSGDKKTVLKIALGKIKVNGVEKTLPIVPAGTGLGMTTKAAGEMGIPGGGLKNAEFYINDAGVLVINRMS